VFDLDVAHAITEASILSAARKVNGEAPRSTPSS
jgi:hypothetical protein